MWRRQDSNLGRLSRQIYSLLPLAARASPQGCSGRDCRGGQFEGASGDWLAAPTTYGTLACRSGSVLGWMQWSVLAAPGTASQCCTRCTPRCSIRPGSARTAGSTRPSGSGTSRSDHALPRGTPGGHALIRGGIQAVRGETRPRSGHAESNTSRNEETPSDLPLRLVGGGLPSCGGARIRTWEG